jgi:hypothetical protein
MESSMMNIEIVDAYKAAAAGLKASREGNGMNIDSVEDVIEKFEAEVNMTFYFVYNFFIDNGRFNRWMK